MEIENEYWEELWEGAGTGGLQRFVAVMCLHVLIQVPYPPPPNLFRATAIWFAF